MTQSCDRDFAKELKKAIRQYRRITDAPEWEAVYIYLSQKTLDWLVGESPKYIKNLDAMTTFYGMKIVINDALPYQACWITSEPPYVEKEEENESNN